MTGAFEWVVVGAGPAGIASVGQLLDAGIEPACIAWIDPEFRVGDFGTSWQKVTSNTPVDSFLKFLRASRAFGFGTHPTSYLLEKLPGAATCPLGVVAEPLRWITERLRQQVQAITDRVVSLARADNAWRLTLLSGRVIETRRVVLAIGSEPRRLSLARLEDISLAVALDPVRLRKSVHKGDRIAVFGDAQSARSVLENLINLPDVEVVHFYRSKASAQRHLDAVDLSGCKSLRATASNMLAALPGCNKTIYAIGFERRGIQIDELPRDLEYDPNTGIIAPGIYGLGIAFPEIRPHELGRAEFKVVSLWPMMSHLQQCLPLWMADRTDIDPIQVERLS